MNENSDSVPKATADVIHLHPAQICSRLSETRKMSSQDVNKEIKSMLGLAVSEEATWDGDSDPQNPLHWPQSTKWLNVALIVMQAILSPIASTVLAIGAAEIAEEFHLTSAKLPVFPTAFYVLGISTGPLVLAPCSEVYGKRIVYLLSLLCFMMLNIGCALAPNITVLTTLRFFSGVAGSVGPSLSSGSIGDMFTVLERGRPQAIASFGPVFGPVLGGVLGGFIVYYTSGWRWLLWTVAIAAGVTSFLSVCLLRESYGPFILAQRAACLRKTDSRTRCYTHHEAPVGSVILRTMTRPARLLFTSPVLGFIALYQSLIYGILYLHLITISLLFGPSELYGLYSYQWTHGTTGLAYLGAGTGALIGVIVTAKFMNRSLQSELLRARRNIGGEVMATPEMRIPFLRYGMFIVPFGLIIFAWSAGRTHWILPLVGAMFFGIGMVMGYICTQSYLVDCFGAWSASALAAVIMVRCPITTVFCLFGFELYRRLGYDWGSMLLVFLCIGMLPFPFLLRRFGPHLRTSQSAV